QSCDTMWRGVTVLANGVATLSGSTVRDAENGVLLQDGGVLKVANSYFYDNIIGINAQPELTLTDVYGQAQLYVTGTAFAPLSGFKKDYQQQSAHGTVPLSGIWLNKMYCTIGDSLMQENNFSKMVYGIYSQNSHLTLTNSRFTNIHNHASWVAKAKGTAVVSWGNKWNSLSSLTMRPATGTGSTVTQCDRGIYATWSDNDVSKVEMSQVLTGIYSANGKGLKGIYNANSIYAVKYGIWLARNEGAKSNTVTENNIYMQGSSKGIAILLDEWNNAMSAQYMITGNLIELRSAAAGIVSSYALHPNIHYNNIYQYATGSSLPHTTGISLQGSDTASVSCNYIISDYPADSNFVSIGIEVAQSKQFTLNCNTIKYENCGVYMGGDCQMKNTYRSNQVDSCDMGLYLNNAAIIGQQFHKGNRWLNVLNKVNATNVGSPILSPIVVHTNVNTIWHPLNISPNGPWFIPKSGTPEQCGTDCYAAFTSGEDTLLLHNIARGDSLSTGFVDETKNIAQQNLYDLLDLNDTLRYSDSVLTDFYDSNQLSTTGKLNTVKDYIKAASSVSSYFSELLHLNDSLMVQTKDSISLADSLLHTDSLLYGGIKEQLLVKLNTLMLNEKTLQEQIEAIQQGEWNNSKIENSNIQPLWPPEVNRKKMNELIALVAETGEDSIQNYSSDLYSIAMQCPYSGGVSVYQARNMLRFINDSMEYDDGIACLQQGIYRMGKAMGRIENYNAIDFDLIPNPADGKTEVRILTPVDGLTKLTLRTMLGQIMEEWKLDGQQQYTIFTNKYLQGVYMIELKSENGEGRFKKLIIVR
ncbi:MAG: T9SS type A sorting domain-containing protein, partial [Bacteroidetes bacterium]|nr:T9SS type A sorting domain-containing protein [Bacteroidota bacterium]